MLCIRINISRYYARVGCLGPAVGLGGGLEGLGLSSSDLPAALRGSLHSHWYWQRGSEQVPKLLEGQMLASASLPTDLGGGSMWSVATERARPKTRVTNACGSGDVVLSEGAARHERGTGGLRWSLTWLAPVHKKYRRLNPAAQPTTTSASPVQPQPRWWRPSRVVLM